MTTIYGMTHRVLANAEMSRLDVHTLEVCRYKQRDEYIVSLGGLHGQPFVMALMQGDDIGLDRVQVMVNGYPSLTTAFFGDVFAALRKNA